MKKTEGKTKKKGTITVKGKNKAKRVHKEYIVANRGRGKWGIGMVFGPIFTPLKQSRK